jgi:hypothetical protein
MLRRWLSNQDKNIKKMILVGVSALCWAIWRRQNDIVFNKTKYTSFIQALFRGTYWLRFWSQLQPNDDTKGDVLNGELDAKGYCLGTCQSWMGT